MSINIIPTKAAVGAEIKGVDLSRDLKPDVFEAIDDAFNQQEQDLKKQFEQMEKQLSPDSQQ